MINKATKINPTFFNIYELIREIVEEEEASPVVDVSVDKRNMFVDFKLSNKNYNIHLQEV